jgi:hypothetical protein
MLLAIPLAYGQQNRTTEPELWGGRGISVRNGPSGASIDFDCARGSTDQPLRPDAAGDFSVSGTYTPERGGPVRRDELPENLRATYKGNIAGDTMTLQVILTGNAGELPRFTLRRGSSGRVVKCR